MRVHGHDDEFRIASPAPLGWAMYDFVYSLFFFLLLTTGVTPWIIDDLHRPDFYVSLTQVCVALVELALMPQLGSYADRSGRRLALFGWLTLGAGVASALLGVIDVHARHGVLFALVLAGLASGLLQFGFAQYEPLLPSVAPELQRGRVSGLATGLGFLGVIAATAIGLAFDDPAHRQQLFVPNALILLVGLAGCWFAIRTRTKRRPQAGDRAPAATSASRHRARDSWRLLLGNRAATRLLVAKFLYTDAIGTVVTYLLVYMHRLGGLSGLIQHVVLGVGVLSGAAASLAVGRVVERVGPRVLLMGVLPAFSITMAVGAAIGKPWTVWIMAPIVGGSLGTVWTADRIFLLRLIPLDARGELFGFFNIVNRAAGSVGPLIFWSGTIYVLWNWTHALSALGASRVALVMLGASALVGWLIVRGLSDAVPVPTTPPIVDDSVSR